MRTNKLIHSLNAQAHTFAFDLLFLKLKQKLSNFPKLKVLCNGIEVEKFQEDKFHDLVANTNFAEENFVM